MKCSCCGKKLDDDNDVIDEKGCKYIPADIKASNYALTGRLTIGSGKNTSVFILSVPSPKIGTGKPPRPFCPACFLKKMRRAVTILESELEGKDLETMDDNDDEQPQAEQPKKKPEIIVPSAEEIKRDYPDWVKLVTKTNNGVPLEDEDLREIFRMQRKIGAV